MLPIPISHSVVTAYNVSTWNNTQFCGRPLGGASALPSLLLNNIVETSATLPCPIRPTTTILPFARSRRNLREALRFIQLLMRRSIWVCFTSETHQSTHSKFFLMLCLKRSAQISPAKENSATMSLVTSPIPGSSPRSNARPSLRLLIISTRIILVGSTSIIF